MSISKPSKHHRPAHSVGLLLLSLAWLAAGCNVINPDEPVPAYVQVNSVALTTDPFTEGANTHNITDVWVYVDDQAVGVYEWPFTVPVLPTGKREVALVAGIKINGTAGTRGAYPFYALDSMTIDLQAAVVDTLAPQFTYIDNIAFALLEDFETGNDFTGLSRIQDDPQVAYGKAAGKMTLDASTSSKEAVSNGGYILPAGGTPVYLEVDYKCDNKFSIGVQAVTATNVIKNFIAVVTPKNEWHKIYIELTRDVSTLNALSYEVLIGAALEEGNTTANIYLDNIKLLYVDT